MDEKVPIVFRKNSLLGAAQNNTPIIDFHDDEEISDGELTKLTKLAKKQMAIEDKIEDLSKQSKELNAQLLKVSQEDIPGLMASIGGISEIKLKIGAKVQVLESVHTSIAKKNKDTAHRWLMNEEHGDIIKHSILIKFDKKEEIKAKNVVNLIGLACRLAERMGDSGGVDEEVVSILSDEIIDTIKLIGPDPLDINRDAKVHPQTLKSFVTDRLKVEANSNDIPEKSLIPQKSFGVYTLNNTKITRT